MSPAWVIDMLKELTAEGKSKGIAAGLISEAGHPCTSRMVKRWKEQHGIRRVWRGSDAELDQVVSQLHSNDELFFTYIYINFS